MADRLFKHLLNLLGVSNVRFYRHRPAAKVAGLQRLPCIEVDVDTRGMLEISLIENLQRKDLNPFEESAALQRLSKHFRYTHEEIAKKLGKSRTVITEMLSLSRLPDEIQDRCRQADIVSKSMLLQIVRQNSAEDMHRLIDKIAGEGMTREDARRFKRPEARRKNYTYRYKPDGEDFRFTLTFRKTEVEPHELIQALQSVLTRLLEDARRDTADDEGDDADPRAIPARPVGPPASTDLGQPTPDA